MSNNCDFLYKGKKYSSDKIKKVIVSEMPIVDQTESIQWLSDHLKMTPDDVIIVAGLIDGRSLGRFREDSKILLSDKSDIRTAKHEAFHKVWRTYLTVTERAAAIAEFKKDKNWKLTIEPLRKYYPSLSENDLVEEYFANEFEDYTLQPKTFKTNVILKSIFDRLYNFIKSILGLKSTDVKSVYDKILNKEFDLPKYAAYGSADSVIIDGVEFTVANRNDIVNYLSQQFVSKIINSKSGIDAFLDGTAKEKIPTLIKILQGEIAKSGLSDEHYEVVLSDLDKGMGESVFLSEVVSKLKQLGLEITTEEDDSAPTEIKDAAPTREFVSSIEVNPKTGLSGKIKILLSSFQHPTKVTETGVPAVISWGAAFNQVANHLAGIPTEYAEEELLNLPASFKDQLVEILGYDGSNWTDTNIMFRNEFISKMSLTENNFLMLLYGDDKETGKKDMYFADLNSETRKDNVFRRWKTNLDYLLSKYDDVDQFYKDIQARIADTASIRDSIEKVDAVLDILGITVNDAVKPDIVNLVNNMAAVIPTVKKFDSKLNPYSNFTIEGTVKAIAAKESVFEEQQDLMITVNGTKIYALSRNTQQTIISNKIKYLVNRGSKEGLSGGRLIEYLMDKMPEVFNSFNVTKTEDGYELNKLLARYMTSGVKLSIPYTVKNEREDSDEVSKLDEPDLATLHIHGALKGKYISLKHSDRSTFFAYDVGEPFYPAELFKDKEDGVEIIRSNLVKEIQKEVELARETSQHQPIQYLNFTKGGYGTMLGESRFAELVAGDSINTTDLTKLSESIRKEFKNFVEDVERFGLYNKSHTAGFSKAELSKFQTTDTEGKSKPDIERLLMAAFANEVSFHIFESRLFSGDNRTFKSVSDLYKRLAAQSSNGLLTVTNKSTNDYIRKELDQTYEMFDIASGKIIRINTSDNLDDNNFRAVTLKEEEHYQSTLLNPALDATGKPRVSKLGIVNPSELAMSFEFGFLQDIPNPTPAEKAWMIKKIEQAESAYSKINENDGQSYMTLPAFKNYMIRFGQWTDEMEVSYQIEQALLKYSNLNDAKNITVTIKGTKNYDGITFKPFEVKQGDDFNRRLIGDRTLESEALHTLKTQFYGPTVQESLYNQGKDAITYSFNALFKTSQHLLQPSAIMGTNLHAMNNSMLKNNIQIVHMGSANKVGAIDPSRAANKIKSNPDDIRNQDSHVLEVAEKGLTFYKDGFFNSDVFEKSTHPQSGFANYLSSWEYLKDQVNIGNKEKAKISGSTQSLKLMLANLMINGQERFPGAKQIVDQYKDLIREIVKSHADEFFEEIGWDGSNFKSLDQFKDVVLKSSQVQNSPDNVKNEIINFFEDPSNGIETLSLREKIENVLYSMVSNNIIDFKRTGNAYPQAASTGYEYYGKRLITDGKYQSDVLDFYKPVFDEEGNVTSIKPAEIILPLPTKWVNQVLNAAKTDNIVDALNWLNKQIEIDKQTGGDKFLMKGLRIPNQQLSSNDLFRVKKFTLPTVQAYVIVPSELVIKVGSD